VVKSPRIDELRRAIETAGPAALDEFWHDVGRRGTPLVEPLDRDRRLVTFLWRGEATTTSVSWGVNLPLQRLGGTDLWHGSVDLPANLRTVYYLIHDGAIDVPVHPGDGPTHIDATNHHPFLFPRDPRDPTDKDNWASLLELPLAPAEPWLAPSASPGTTVDAVLDSAALGGPRHVGLHLPAGVEPAGLPVLLVFDGNLSRTVLGIPSTVDSLSAAGRIPPMAVVLVHTPDDRRLRELSPHESIVDHIADEVLPWAYRGWSVGGDPSRNVIAGSSLGGLTASWVALRRPDLFGAVVSQSGSYWWPRLADGEPEWLTRRYTEEPLHPLRFYLDVGSWEDGPGMDGGPSQVEVNRRFRDTLRQRGYPVAYHEYTGGHDYVNWRRTFADGLLAVLDGSGGLNPA
jgi:enterochelin esterase family protein